jgi:hypothetical protein
VNQTSSKDITKELFIISSISENFPNSWTITRRLQRLHDNISNKKKLKENPIAIISILIEIALKNPKSYPIITALLSKILSFIDDKNEKYAIFKKIEKKFSIVPNTEHLEIWLQRIKLTLGSDFSYESSLCKKVSDPITEIWNCEWFNATLQNIFLSTPIIDQDIIDNLNPIISSDEVAVFRNSWYGY